jgi:hypothetical protein
MPLAIAEIGVSLARAMQQALSKFDAIAMGVVTTWCLSTHHRCGVPAAVPG